MLLRRSLYGLLIGLLFVASSGGALAQGSAPGAPSGPATLAGTGFTYQGELHTGSALVSATCSFQFSLYDALASGSQVGATETVSAAVASGRFTVVLNDTGQFGARAFDGSARWLAAAVKCPPDAGYTPLTPRQPLTAAPLALALPGLRTELNATSPNVIGGSISNTVALGVSGATIGGGGDTLGDFNRVSASYGTVGGGGFNLVSGSLAVVGGGYGNTASGDYATVGGGYSNKAVDDAMVGGGIDNTANTLFATVGGGRHNTAGYDAAVGGGNTNTASGAGAVVGGGGSDGSHIAGNTAAGPASTIGGGYGNGITALGTYATVGGGYGNAASNNVATVGGGDGNVASGAGATVGGGGNDGSNAAGNVAAGAASTIGGGFSNSITSPAFYGTVAGGTHNTASAAGATVGGGDDNTAGNSDATVPGGFNNTASGYASFAAGNLANAQGDGDFVWSDSSIQPITATIPNLFLARASGGFALYTNAGATIGAALLAGSSSWSIISDRNMKANFDTVDGVQVLNALAGIPIQTWNYKTQATAIRHMGPMAQDFKAAFGVGENDTTISTVDAQGVAFAAIQGLHTLVQQKDAQIAQQQADITTLQAKVATLQGGQADVNAHLKSLETRLAPGLASQPAPTPLPFALPWLLLAGLVLLNVGGAAGYLLARARKA